MFAVCYFVSSFSKTDPKQLENESATFVIAYLGPRLLKVLGHRVMRGSSLDILKHVLHILSCLWIFINFLYVIYNLKI